eukprot:6635706-Prymnesium_polylepis.1
MHFLPRRKGAEIERGSVATGADERHVTSTNALGNARAERIACLSHAAEWMDASGAANLADRPTRPRHQGPSSGHNDSV